MLNHQTMEKLISLRLEGMVQALEEQRRQVDISQLDFEERLALLVERQWSWRDYVKRLVMWSDSRNANVEVNISGKTGRWPHACSRPN